MTRVQGCSKLFTGIQKELTSRFGGTKPHFRRSRAGRTSCGHSKATEKPTRATALPEGDDEPRTRRKNLAWRFGGTKPNFCRSSACGTSCGHSKATEKPTRATAHCADERALHESMRVGREASAEGVFGADAG